MICHHQMYTRQLMRQNQFHLKQLHCLEPLVLLGLKLELVEQKSLAVLGMLSEQSC
jgi:hypothetical protein